jgi:tetratricopeptide (TPR) repeat protein
MSLKFTSALLFLLLVYSNVCSGQKSAPEIIYKNGVDLQLKDPAEWDATVHRYQQALAVATHAQTDQRRAVYGLNLGLALLHEGRYRFADAEKYFQAASVAAKSLFGEQSTEVVRTVNNLGEAQLEQGRIADADRSFHLALKANELVKDANRIDTAAVLNNLANVQHMTGHLSKAAALMRKSVEIFETESKAYEEGFGTSLFNLAMMLRDVGALPEAIASAQRAVSILERCKNSDTLALGLVMLSRLRVDQGDLTGALAVLQRALEKLETRGKEDNVARALVLSHLGVLYSRTGKKGEAEPCFQKALDVNRRLLGPEHPQLLDCMSAYADFLRATKRKAEAKKLEAYVRERREKYRTQNPSIDNVVDISSLMKRQQR